MGPLVELCWLGWQNFGKQACSPKQLRSRIVLLALGTVPFLPGEHTFTISSMQASSQPSGMAATSQLHSLVEQVTHAPEVRTATTTHCAWLKYLVRAEILCS